MNLTWGEAEVAAQDKTDWRQRVEPSCSARSYEQEEEEENNNIIQADGKFDENMEKGLN